MTVTELREALQALEAQGKGALRCVAEIIDDDNPAYFRPAELELNKVSKWEAGNGFQVSEIVALIR